MEHVVTSIIIEKHKTCVLFGEFIIILIIF